MPTPMQRRLLILPRRAVPLLRDSFTDANGTNLTAHTPDVGTAWTAVAGTMQVQTNAAQVTGVGGGGDAVYTLPGGAGDSALGVSCLLPAGGDMALIFRYQDNNNHWLAQFVESLNRTRILDKVAGSYTERAANNAITLNTGVPKRLVANAVGAQIDLYVDDAAACSYASAATFLTQTTVGFRGVDTAGSNADSLVVWPAGAVAVPGGVV